MENNTGNFSVIPEDEKNPIRIVVKFPEYFDVNINSVSEINKLSNPFPFISRPRPFISHPRLGGIFSPSEGFKSSKQGGV